MTDIHVDGREGSAAHLHVPLLRLAPPASHVDLLLPLKADENEAEGEERGAAEQRGHNSDVEVEVELRDGQRAHRRSRTGRLEHQPEASALQREHFWRTRDHQREARAHVGHFEHDGGVLECDEEHRRDARVRSHVLQQMLLRSGPLVEPILPIRQCIVCVCEIETHKNN